MIKQKYRKSKEKVSKVRWKEKEMKFYIEEPAEISAAAIRGILEECGHSLAGSEVDSGAFGLSAARRAEKGYEIEKKGGKIRIAYGETLDFFRALGEVFAWGGEEEITRISSGCEGTHGVLYDCSRNGVLRIEQVKYYIRMQALMGLKYMYLYTEDTYEVEAFPYFGALRGRYTKDEIRECDEYAMLYGVELVPCIQTLAHLRTALRWPCMAGYRDDKDILIVGEEQTYRLIDEMLKSVREMYHSRRIHLGMDEAKFLGCGAYREKYGPAGQGELIKRHLDKVMELCRKHGLEPMIWSDMFFVTPGHGDYYGVGEEHEWPENERPDPDITLVYWDYYSHEEARYRRMANLHRKLTDKVVFACGAWIWNGLAPNYAKAMSSIEKGFQGLRGTGVQDSFLTLWLDNGAETPMDAGLPMMAYYSRCVYGENSGKTEDVWEEETEQWFRALTGGSWKNLLLLDRIDHIPGTSGDNREFANPSKMLFYQDPLVGIFDAQFEGAGLTEYYGKLSEMLKATLQKAEEQGENVNRAQTDLLEYYVLMSEVLEQKAGLGFRIRRAYLEADKKTLMLITEVEIPELSAKAAALRKAREKIWYREYKPNGYEVLDIRFSGVEARLRTAKERIKKYLDGSIRELPELKEERLPYLTERGTYPSCNLWENIVSAANIEGV